MSFQNNFYCTGRRRLLLSVLFLILSDNIIAKETQNKTSPLNLESSVDCIQLFIYFDIDNTANSYFNNITYFLNKYEKIVNGNRKNVNLIVPDGFVEGLSEKIEFLGRFKIDTNYWKINLLISDSMLNTLHDFQGLAKYRFIKNKIPILAGTCKWDKLDQDLDEINCNSENLKVKVLLLDKTNIKKKTITTNNVIKIIDSNLVVLVNDYHNKIMFLQFKNKTLSYNEFNWREQINPISVYCENFAENEEACEIAKAKQFEIKKMSKEEAFFTNLAFNDSFIFASLNIYAHEKRKSDFIFTNDIGGFDTIKKGQIIANQFSILLKFDRNLKYISYSPVSDDNISSKNNQKLLAGIDYGFYINNKSELFSYLSPFDMNFKDSTLDYAFGKFKKNEKGIYTFKSFENILFPENYSSTWFASSFVNPIFINDTISASFGSYNCFAYGNKKIFIDKDRDKSTLEKENIFAHFKENEKLRYNYHILGISNIKESDIITVFYKVGNEFCIEIFDSYFKTIGIKILDRHDLFPSNLNFDDLDSGCFDLNNDILAFNYRDKGNIYLMRYKILFIK